MGKHTERLWNVLIITIIFVSLSQQDGSKEGKKISWQPTDGQNNFIEKDTFFNYINMWNTSIAESEKDDDPLIEPEPQLDDIEAESESLFQSSSNNTSLILTDLSNCLTSYSFYDCVRMLLLSRLKSLVNQMDLANATGEDFHLLRGLVNFKWVNSSDFPTFKEIEHKVHHESSLNHQLNTYILRLFKSRLLQVYVLPGFGVEIAPKEVSDKNGLVCFNAKAFQGPDFSSEVAEMRKKADQQNKKKKKKGGGFNMMPMMIVPQMIMLGMLPFALANLKMMVMNAFMMNSMALNSAIFMTIRNLVFGPKKGPKIKYVNYGYTKGKVNKKPELILHSPAAFVKKPEDSYGSIMPNMNHYDDPNSYHVNSPPYNRRNEQKRRNQNQQKDKIRIRTKVKHTEPQNFGHSKFSPPTRPHQQETFNSEQFEQSSYDSTDVDAPISYLNNNQFLKPTLQSNLNYQTISSNYPYDVVQTTTPINYYQSFNDVYLQSQSNNDFTSSNENEKNNFETKNLYSSKFNQEGEQGNNNYYYNHRT